MPKKYDLIVCNPPYFQNDMKCPNRQRSGARHDVDLSYAEMFECVDKLLSKDGRFSIVAPSSQMESIVDLAFRNNLFLSRKTIVFPTPNSQAKRCLMEFVRTEKEVESSELIIEESRHTYTEQYKLLTGEFYL